LNRKQFKTRLDGSHPAGCRGANFVLSNYVVRVLVTPLKNKRGMSAFPESGRSNGKKITRAKGRKRPRLCENVFEFDDTGTAHHIGN
jgi:hypothetical protein